MWNINQNRCDGTGNPQLTLVTPPESEPVTLAEAKFHCKVDDSDSDDYISALITAAREYAEQYQNRALMPQAWLMTLDYFPDIIRVSKPPLISASVEYDDSNDDTITLSSAVVDTYSTPGRIVPAYGQCFPITRAKPACVRVTFQCGYADADHVPAATKTAIKMIVAHLFEIRQPILTGSISSKLPYTVDALLDLHKFYGYS